MSSPRIVPLNYLAKFRCTTSACEDTCCRGWDIPVDEVTVERMAECPDAALKDEFARNLIDEGIERRTPARSARFKSVPGRQCVFLDPEHLCSIQKRGLAQYLPCLCHRYPYEENIVDGVRERSGSTSCPEIARIALLSQEPIAFAGEATPDRWPHLFHREISPSSAKSGESALGHFAPVRKLCLKIMQTRTRSFEKRFDVLGALIHELDALTEARRFDVVPEVLTKLVRKQMGWFCWKRARSLDTFTAGVIKKLCDYELLELVLSERYHRALEAVRAAFGELVSDSPQQICHELRRMELHFVRPFLRKYPLFFENHLVNLMLKHLFPFEEGRSYAEQYQAILLHYTLVRVHLASLALQNEGLTPDVAIAAVQPLMRTWDADKQYRAVFRGVESYY